MPTGLGALPRNMNARAMPSPVHQKLALKHHRGGPVKAAIFCFNQIVNAVCQVRRSALLSGAVYSPGNPAVIPFPVPAETAKMASDIG